MTKQDDMAAVRVALQEQRRRDQAALEHGTCSVCGTVGEFERIPNRPPRGDFKCPRCGATLRYRHQADVIVELYDDHAKTLAQLADRASFRALDIYEPGVGGPFRHELTRVPGYVRSYYWNDVPRGQLYQGVRSEDLQALTFPDQAFDLVISSDIFEHVRDPGRAFAEVFRVLNPRGRHVFTVPVTWPLSSRSVHRVDTSGPDDVFIFEPRYHRSPREEEGSLVYTDFGLDLPERLRERGFRTAVHHGYRNTLTFVATRPR